MQRKKISRLFLSIFVSCFAFLLLYSGVSDDSFFKSSLQNVLADDSEGTIVCYDATSDSITISYNEPLEGLLVYLYEDGDDDNPISCGVLTHGESLHIVDANTCDTALNPGTSYRVDITGDEISNVYASRTCSTLDDGEGPGEVSIEEGQLIIDTFVVGGGDSGWYDSTLDNRTAICNNRAIQQVPPGHPCARIYDSCFLGTAGGDDDTSNDVIDDDVEVDDDNNNNEEALLKRIKESILSFLSTKGVIATNDSNDNDNNDNNDDDSNDQTQQQPQQQIGTPDDSGRVFACHIGLAAQFLTNINYDIFVLNLDGSTPESETDLVINHEYFFHIEAHEEEEGEWIFEGSVFDTPIIEWRSDSKADFDAQIPIGDEYLTSFRVSAREMLGLDYDNVWEEVRVGVAATLGGAKTAEIETNENCRGEKTEEGFLIQGVEIGICEVKIHIEGPHAYGTIDNLWFDEGTLPGYIYERDFVINKEEN